MENNHQKFWRLAGKFYGYPQCCIDEFVNGTNHGIIPRDVHKGYGFLPCIEHSNGILRGEITIESLINDRICHKPYPNQDDLQFEGYITNIKCNGE